MDPVRQGGAENTAAGIKLLQRPKISFRPELTHWGTRWFVARDPDGNLLAFEQEVQRVPEGQRALPSDRSLVPPRLTLSALRSTGRPHDIQQIFTSGL